MLGRPPFATLAGSTAGAARFSESSGGSVARTDVIVVGAGIVGTSIAVHLAKRGLAVALIERGGVGEGTSYGNAGVIEGNTVFPPAFPSDWGERLRIALKRSPQANYHFSFLPKIAPWLATFYAASQPARLIETARLMRPLMARAVAEHEALSAEAGAERYFRRTGWLKLYRSEHGFAAQQRELGLARVSGTPMWPPILAGGARPNRPPPRRSGPPCH